MSEIKVTDRRMFTPDGRLREEFERELAEPTPEPEAPPEPIPEPTPSPEAPPLAAPSPPEVAAGSGLPASAPESPPPGMLELVEFLAGWALACLGEMPMPDGRLARDLDAARFYIDLIGALHERWGSRLGPEEIRFLESYLDQLRLRYVARRG
ncbi:MAG TPA: DUF1844 domain-containing protein [Thermoanaerobaculia bacterium]|nr:DUF1844 domain-containing protein [Thermoanaerobaculia bacterium]